MYISCDVVVYIPFIVVISLSGIIYLNSVYFKKEFLLTSASIYLSFEVRYTDKCLTIYSVHLF